MTLPTTTTHFKEVMSTSPDGLLEVGKVYLVKMAAAFLEDRARQQSYRIRFNYGSTVPLIIFLQ